jgi:hypothetical protein
VPLFPAFNIYKDELREFFPYKSLQVERAEADDIIAILSLRASAGGDPVTIWSSDTDDLQLQLIEPKIKQYSYVRKKYITPKSEKYSLFEHIVRGDAHHGVDGGFPANAGQCACHAGRALGVVAHPAAADHHRVHGLFDDFSS